MGLIRSSPEDVRRVQHLSVLSVLVFLVLGFRLFQLQVLKGPDLERRAEINRSLWVPLSARRGNVTDRKGVILLDSSPRFSLFFSPPRGLGAEMSGAMLGRLQTLLPDPDGIMGRRFANALQSGRLTRLKADLPQAKALGVLENRLVLPGVTVLVEPRRRACWPGVASHLLGYVDEATAEDLDNNLADRPEQWIGRTGVERTYDRWLKGVDGGLRFEVDALGRTRGVLAQEPFLAGAEVRLSLDESIQAAAEEGLRLSPTGRGAAVALDPRNGAVLAFASAPSYSLGEGFSQALVDKRLPLFNRALQGTYPPGSVFKIITAATALDQGWDRRRTFLCPGYFELGPQRFGCWSTHGVKDFNGAVAFSCNVYFFNLGLAVGPDRMVGMARAFGLGEKTGIDLPAETAGVLPEPRYRKGRRVGWFDGNTLNFSIGQGQTLVTPLQAAVLVAAAGNGGAVWSPTVVEEVRPSVGGSFRPAASERRQVNLSPQVWEQLHRAMESVVAFGSGRGVARKDLTIGAKTGTAQNPHGEDHAWFTCYAGKKGEPPSLALAVIVENGGLGSQVAGPVAQRMLAAAFPAGNPSWDK